MRRVGGLPPWGSVALFFPGRLGRTASSSFTETSSSHAGRGGPPSLSQGAAPCPPPGRRLRRASQGQRPRSGRSGKGEDLPACFEASAAGDGFFTDEIANSASSPGSPSPGLNGWLSSSVGESPSAVAPAPKPLLKLLRRSGRGWLSLSPDWVAAGHLSARDRSAGSPILWGCSCPWGRDRSSV